MKRHFTWIQILSLIGTLALLIACSPPSSRPPHQETTNINSSSTSSSASSDNETKAPEDTGSTGEVNSSGVADFSGSVDGFQYEIRDVNQIEHEDRVTFLANVANMGNESFIGTQFALTLYDASGSVVDSEQIQTQTDIVPPGLTSPIWFSFDKPISWSSYEIEVTSAGSNIAALGAEAVNVSVTPSSSSNAPCNIVTIKNEDDVTADFIFIAERHYDAHGRLISASIFGPDRAPLPPGETTQGECLSQTVPYDLQAIAIAWPSQ